MTRRVSHRAAPSKKRVRAVFARVPFRIHNRLASQQAWSSSSSSDVCSDTSSCLRTSSSLHRGFHRKVRVSASRGRHKDRRRVTQASWDKSGRVNIDGEETAIPHVIGLRMVRFLQNLPGVWCRIRDSHVLTQELAIRKSTARRAPRQGWYRYLLTYEWTRF